MIRVLLAMAVVAVPALLEAQCTESRLLTVSATDAMIREVRLSDLTVVNTYEIDVPGQTVVGATGISVNPVTGETFLLLLFDAPPPFDVITNLVTIDFQNDPPTTNPIGSTVIPFVGLTFDDAGACLSISDENATPPNAFCELSQITGAPTDLCELGAGDDGDAVAFRGENGLVYHAAGTNNVIFEVATSIDVTPCATTDIDISGTDLAGAGMRAMTWWETSDIFVWAQEDPTNPMYTVSATGDVAFIGELDHSPSGMTVIEVPVPCPMDLFIRGDVDGNGSFTGLVDGLFLLNFQFVAGSPAPPCMKSADADGNGSVTGLVDGLYLLNFQFVSGSPPPPAPFPMCGEDAASPLDCGAPLMPPC